jgi:fumarate reductase subunit D
VGLPPLVPHNPFANAEFAGIERVIPFMTNWLLELLLLLFIILNAWFNCWVRSIKD